MIEWMNNQFRRPFDESVCEQLNIIMQSSLPCNRMTLNPPTPFTLSLNFLLRFFPFQVCQTNAK